MARNIGFRLLAIAPVIFFAPECVRAQSALSSIVGGPLDGAPALGATLTIPCAAVADGNGNVYVGLKGNHQVVKIDKSGTVRIVAGNGVVASSGDGGPAKLAALITPAGLALDSAGSLYIADSDGNRIRRVGTDGAITTFAGTGTIGNSGNGGPAIAARLKNPSALAFDRSGNLLIADTGNHVIRMVTPGGTITAIAGNGTNGYSGDGGPALSAQLYAPAGLAVDSGGKIYIADTKNSLIRVVSSGGTITRYAGVNTAPAAGSDLTIATNATLTLPISLALDQAGNLYFVEYGWARVRRITADGYVEHYAGTGFPGTSGDGGWAFLANLNVLGIAMDSQNNLLIADGVTNRVRIVSAATGFIETLAGSGWATFDPRGVAVKGNTVYFSDGAGNRVRAFNATTAALTVVAGNGLAAYAGDGGDATLASLSGPRGLALDGSGNLYIADTGNNRIRRVTTDGKISTVAGTGDASSTGDGFGATNATIHGPAAVTVDAAGNLFIAEQLGQYIRKVGTDGKMSTVAGTGIAGAPAAESGVALNQLLNSPQGLAAEPGGTVLIADSGNSRIRRLFPDGTIATVAGSKTSGSSGDGGLATFAQLRSPFGVVADSAGNIYIADSNNSTIRWVNSAGVIATVAGTGVRGFSGDGSPATAYQLFTPYAVAVGPSGSLIIADTSNQRVRQLAPANGVLTLAFPAGPRLSADGRTPATQVSLIPLPVTRRQVTASNYPAEMGAMSSWTPAAPVHVQKAVIASGGVAGAGLREPQLSPNGVAVISGSSFAPAETNATVGSAGLVDGKVLTNLGGVCVLVGSIPAPVLAWTPARIVFQAPQVPVLGTLPVQVVTGCGTEMEMRSDPEMALVQSAAPEFFYFAPTADGQNPIVAANAVTGDFIGSPELLPGATFVPAKPGDGVTLYATGLGATERFFAAGEAPDMTSPITGDFWISVGPTRLAPEDVQYVGVSPSEPGVYEVRIHLPESIPDGDQPVRISVNGFVSPSGGYITVRR